MDVELYRSKFSRDHVRDKEGRNLAVVWHSFIMAQFCSIYNSCSDTVIRDTPIRHWPIIGRPIIDA